MSQRRNINVPSDAVVIVLTPKQADVLVNWYLTIGSSPENEKLPNPIARKILNALGGW